MAWQKRRRLVRPLADAVAWQARALAAQLPDRQPLQRARVVATLIHRRGPMRDFDNSVSSLKETLDSLVTGGLLVSDAPGHLELEVVQTVGPECGVRFEIWPLP
jgi:hypothetical protein